MIRHNQCLPLKRCDRFSHSATIHRGFWFSNVEKPPGWSLRDSLVKLDVEHATNWLSFKKKKRNYCISQRFIRCCSNCPSSGSPRRKNVAVNVRDRKKERKGDSCSGAWLHGQLGREHATNSASFIKSSKNERQGSIPLLHSTTSATLLPAKSK